MNRCIKSVEENLSGWYFAEPIKISDNEINNINIY